MRARLRVAELAHERGWSKNKLAAQAHIDRKAVDPYWDNTAKRLDISVLERLADAFGVTVKDLIADEPPKGERA